MGWSYGFVNGRDVGYGVPAICDLPGCDKEIDRGLAFICGGDIGGGEHGCGLFFCGTHLLFCNIENEYGERPPQLCDVCLVNFRLGGDNYKLFAEKHQPKPDVPEWLRHKLRHYSWAEWRKDNPKEIQKIREILANGRLPATTQRNGKI